MTTSAPAKPRAIKEAPAFYASLYPIIAEEARDSGYAVAIHGTLTRDLDLIAVPWTEAAVSAEVLLARLVDRLGVLHVHSQAWDDPSEQKPHGRLAWSLILTSGTYVDLSVMPRVVAP